MQESYKIGIEVSGVEKDNYNSLSPIIKINNIVPMEWDDDDFVSKLPVDKYGVYIVYEEGTCIYVGETRNNEGFKGRFENHHYLDEFNAKATKVVLYQMDRNLDNDRILFEKIKIKELNPILNRAENRDESIQYSASVLEGIRNKTDDLIELFSNDSKFTNDQIEEMDKRTAKNFRAVLEILNQLDPRGYVENDSRELALRENEIHSIISRTIVGCPRCSGGQCDVCEGHQQIIVKSKCKKCRGIGYTASKKAKNAKSLEDSYCDKCRGTGYDFIPYDETIHTKLYTEPCPSCENTGATGDEVCSECNGERFVTFREVESIDSKK